MSNQTLETMKGRKKNQSAAQKRAQNKMKKAAAYAKKEQRKHPGKKYQTLVKEYFRKH